MLVVSDVLDDDVTFVGCCVVTLAVVLLTVELNVEC